MTEVDYPTAGESGDTDYAPTVTVDRAEWEGMKAEIRRQATYIADLRGEVAIAGQAIVKANIEIERVKGIAKESIERERAHLGRLDEAVMYMRQLEGELATLRTERDTLRQTVEALLTTTEAAEQQAGQYERDEMRGRMDAFSEVLALLAKEGK